MPLRYLAYGYCVEELKEVVSVPLRGGFVIIVPKETT